MDRGNCGFAIKAKNAQNAGASAVVIADNVAGAIAGMSGAEPAPGMASLATTSPMPAADTSRCARTARSSMDELAICQNGTTVAAVRSR